MEKTIGGNKKLISFEKPTHIKNVIQIAIEQSVVTRGKPMSSINLLLSNLTSLIKGSIDDIIDTKNEKHDQTQISS